MTLQTVGTDVKTWYWTNNALSGEQISLRPTRGGMTADRGMGLRYGHQVEGATGVGDATWTLGTKSTFIVLSTAAIAVIATPVSTFGSAGTLSAPVWLQDGAEAGLGSTEQ
jgi:hypothetical protein